MICEAMRVALLFLQLLFGIATLYIYIYIITGTWIKQDVLMRSKRCWPKIRLDALYLYYMFYKINRRKIK